MTRDELELQVPVHESPTGKHYVRLRDIPNPWRSEFAADTRGSTLPVIAGEAECHWVWDWHKWLSLRFQSGYVLRFGGVYKEISDAELDEAACKGQHSVLSLKGIIRKPAQPVSIEDMRINEHTMVLLSDYPVLEELARQRTTAMRLDVRACRDLYTQGLPTIDAARISADEREFLRQLGFSLQ